MGWKVPPRTNSYRTLALLIAAMWAGSIASFAQAQSTEGEYRRVYIRDSDLPVEGFRAMSISSFQTWIEKWKSRDPMAPGYEPELRSFHSQVRLLGADLYAERSRLRWNWDSANRRGRSGIRRSIAPWSPAIDSTLLANEPSSTSLLFAPNWLYDSSGTPSLRITSDEDWFAWTLRPQPNSTPNRLNYAMSFPRTTDSCMVLQLPRSARVSDASGVVRSVGGWNEVAQRVGDWPVALAAPDTVPELNANDAFWLLELSGLDQASFSIILGENQSFKGTGNEDSPELAKVNRLIAKQSLSHSITSQHIKTRCDWEWYETTSNDRTLRMRVPEGMRLRSLTVNDQEASIQFSNRVIDVGIPVVDTQEGSLTTNTRTRVSAEFLSSLAELTSEGIVTIPPIECLNAYVVSGSTTLLPEESIELRGIAATSGRLETVRTTRGSPDRLDYSWFQAPKAISFRVSARQSLDRAEVLTRLSTDSNRAIAVVKIQLTPWHDTAPNLVRLGKSWTIESAQINHKGLQLAFVGTSLSDPSLSNEANQDVEPLMRIERTGPVDTGPVAIEMQMVRDMSKANEDVLHNEPLVSFPSRQCDEVAVIEPGFTSRWVFTGDYSRDLCEEESLTAWQKERLPRLGKFLLFRMNEGKLPSLRWKPEPSLLECSIATTLRDEGDSIHAEHRFNVRSLSPNSQFPTVELPGTWRWEWESSDHWLPLTISQQPSDGRWQIVLPEEFKGEGTSIDGHRFRAVGRLETGATPLELVLPRVLGGGAVSHSLVASSTLSVVPSDFEKSQWRFNQDGQLELRWIDVSSSKEPVQVSVRSERNPQRNRWRIKQSELHVAVDAHGKQRAVLQVDAEGMSNDAWECRLQLPSGWSIDRLIDRSITKGSSQPGKSYSHRRDGDQVLIHRYPHEGESLSRMSELAVVLSGPALSRESFLDWGLIPTRTFSFHWPQILLDSPIPTSQQTLWLPQDLQLAGPPHRNWDWSYWSSPRLPKLEGVWSPWEWTGETASWLLGYVKSVESDGANTIHAPPSELIPNWIALDWLPIAIPQQTTSRTKDLGTSGTIRTKTSSTGPALWLAVVTLLTPSLMRRTPWFVLLLAGLSTVAGHWLPEPLSIWFRSTWVGLGVGSVFYLLRWVTTSTEVRPMERYTRQAQWYPWNEPGLASDGASDESGRASIVASSTVMFLVAFGVPLIAQDITSSRSVLSGAVFDVLIPLDADGEFVGDVVYVPNSVVAATESPEATVQAADRDSYVISAKHTIRFDARSVSFGNTEQPCNHLYEVWIGEGEVGRPWRIPFPSDRSRLSRFLIDGIEVTPSRFVKSDTELLWYPERAGRRTIQIESQLRIRPLERDKNAAAPKPGLLNDLSPPRGWGIDIPVWPAANAILEVEADAGWAVDFNSRGRISNPSIGKFSIQLGGLDRLKGEIVTTSSQASRGAGSLTSDPSSLVSVDSPQMNTELFIEREQLIARTILEYPRNSDAPAEIEIESDLQWQPIGNRWGDAQLIDVRPGSTLDRRRYVMRWNIEGNTNANKRVITATWIPIGNANLRNILFAECRDRRVRPNTLRYARSAGSAWTLEGINTWVPSINTKERIDWLELKERPIATSLKIPVTGGFGVLRQQPESKLQRVRVSQQWILGSSKNVVRSKIEFAAPVNNRKSIIITIPAEYSISKVSLRNTTLQHTSWVEGSHRRLQVFLDRDIGEVNELLVTSEQDISILNTVDTVPPKLEIDGLSTAEHYAELSADPVWRLNLSGDDPNVVSSLRGQGPNKTLSTMDLLGPAPPTKLRVERLQGDWSGLLKVSKIESSETEVRWRSSMVDNVSLDARPTLLVSLPIDMCRQWSSNAVLKEIPSLDPTRRWIQIQPIWSSDNSTASFEVDWVADLPKTLGNTEGQWREWVDRIQFPSDPQLDCLFSDVEDAVPEIDEPSSNQMNSAQDSGIARTTKKDAFPVFAIHETYSGSHPASHRVVHSSVWTDLSRYRKDMGPPLLDWTLSSKGRVTWVTINGEPAPWTDRNAGLTVTGPPLSIPVRIDIWTEYDDGSLSSEGPGVDDLPRLAHPEPTDGFIIHGDHIQRIGANESATWSDVWYESSENNLMVLKSLLQVGGEDSLRREPLPGSIVRWYEFLAAETFGTLKVWGNLGSAEEMARYPMVAATYTDIISTWPLELRQRIQTRARDRRIPQPGVRYGALIDTSLVQTSDAEQTALAWLVTHRQRVIATLNMMLIMVLGAWIWRTLGISLQRSPWWQLTMIGGWIWIFAGTWIPGLILTSIGLLLAIDTYRILNERFRQTGTRVPR
jgi:hypothetical protein